MFEKYDGVRGLWNPQQRAFFNRTGKKHLIPESIVSTMPDIYLDGELWYKIYQYIHNDSHSLSRFGRENYQEASKLAYKANTENINWKILKYQVFDAPTYPGTY